ncbi:MAG TPA: DUF2071 domain-containing protein [Thermoanaerobaculia bacterium]|nr:DUF2071 domain-containing protein [Thermoanaerobaculia bacterium]
MHRHDSIDRITPTLEPDQQVVMYQDWRHLLFLHWEVPAAELQTLVPHGLTVDLFEGKAWVGLIPFTLGGVRPVLLPPMPGVSSFHEINVRTYVHHEGRDPGVYFFSLDASSSIAVEAARLAYHLPYFKSEIAFHASSDAMPLIDFTSRRDDARGHMPANARIRYRPEEGPSRPAAPGTHEHFLAERYILYAKDADHQLWRARVHHQPYPLQRADVFELEETLVWASGIRRPGDPPLRHYAREVNVKIYAPERVG